MKKKHTSILFGAFFYGFIFIVNAPCYSQQGPFLKGKIIEEETNKPLKDVSIILKGTNLFLYSNEKGSFQLEAIPVGTFDLEISYAEYQSKILSIIVSENSELNLGVIFLKKKNENLIFSNVISLNENDFLEDNTGGSDNITGLLQSSKSVFLRTAAFSFGQARFKIRGYDSRERSVLINGIEMNKFFDGRPQWSDWGGLNDVLRNQNNSIGIESSLYGGNRIGGSTNFSTRASAYRKGNSVSLAGTNGSYRGRIMASHFSGIQKNDWSYAISFSSRFANSGFVNGTSYKSWSGFIAVEKKVNKEHSLNFTAMFTPNERGKSSPVTKEVFDLRDNKYNSYWGYQNGKIQNSRIKKISEPILMFSHYWDVNPKLKIKSSLSYQFGFVSNSRLGYQNAENPDPSYYKKLPSYYLRFPDNPDYSTAYLSLQEFQNNGQVNWSNLYETNKTTGFANYYLFEDRNEDKSLSFNSIFEYDWNENLNITGGVAYQNSISSNYAKVIDVLGANGFKDVDAYLDGEASQNNLKTPDREVSVGDDFSYNYILNSSSLKLFSQTNYYKPKWEGFVAMSLENVVYQRNGLYQNGAYSDISFGKGKRIKFLGFGFKTGLIYKLSGRKIFGMHMGYFSQPPFSRNVFTNVRYNHNTVPDVKSENKLTGDFSYEYRSPLLRFKATSYFAKFKNGTEISYTYADGLRRDEADFVSQIVTGIDKNHLGIEFGLEWSVTETVKFTAVVALGKFVYANNPKLYVESDLYQGEDSSFGDAFIKNYKISGTPQNGYSVGFEYRDPKYWWYQINGNILTDNYLQIAPLIRTDNFFTDTDGVPFIDADTGNEITKYSVEELWAQEKFPMLFLLNFVGGKSWKIEDSYLGLFLSFNNVLNQVYKTGGFEQSRNANYENFVKDNSLKNPLFAPKYWHSQGTSYYLILSYRF